MQDDIFNMSRKEERAIALGLILATLAAFTWILIEVANKPVDDGMANKANAQHTSSRMKSISKAFAN